MRPTVASENDMKTITTKEYRQRLSAFVAEEKGTLPPEKRPQGFFGNWGFYAKCRKRFDRNLAREGIEVEKTIVEWPEQTGKIPG